MDYRLQKLRESCEKQGAPALNRLRIASTGRYTSDEVEFLEQYLFTSPESSQILILKILCDSGRPVLDYYDRFDNPSSRLVAKMISIAEKQNDVMTITGLVELNKKNTHLAVLALKRMKRTDCMNQFLLSDDEDLSNLVEDL